MNTKLENRRVVEKLLGPAVEEICVSPATVKQICEGPIDSAWIRALEELEKRSKTIQTKIQGPDKVLAVSEVKPLLENLTNLVRAAACQQDSRLTSRNRQLSEYVTFWSLRSRPYVHLTSMRKSFSSEHSLLTRTFISSWPNIMSSLPMRLRKLT